MLVDQRYNTGSKPVQCRGYRPEEVTGARAISAPQRPRRGLRTLLRGPDLFKTAHLGAKGYPYGLLFWLEALISSLSLNGCYGMPNSGEDPK
ncbi:hypothetical protein BESB_006990 [Besnoitia besnoiti]|uniref:Uncharacterized protein n=1 Tax=Besnoitia besnoiti TaxID=94643 RepID=A0A2A9MIK0_BESBE|nr:hypothetical protein BESB_006990 [Besnoitia besnoiti]PFH38358.1 hypothetical protein BESB_006990 [Besnoitia besnoiti]